MQCSECSDMPFAEAKEWRNDNDEPVNIAGADN